MFKRTLLEYRSNSVLLSVEHLLIILAQTSVVVMHLLLM